jgi:tetratricopeptide (TPR) repeat protein
VLDGSIQRAGDQVRVTVRLYDVDRGVAVWGDAFDQRFDSLFAVEDAVSERLASALALRLSPAERQRLTRRDTDNIEAHRLYLRGLYESRTWTEAGFRRAVDDFRQAIAVDPSYALAWAGLADAYYRNSTLHIPLQEAIPKAKAAAVTALRLDDSLAEAHASLGAIHFRYDWDFAGAERELRRAIELSPGDVSAHQWYSEYLTAMGRTPEAIAEAQIARRLDPLSAEADWQLGLAQLFGRRAQDAVATLRESTRSTPDFWLTHAFLGWSYAETGDCNDALAEYAVARALDDNADVASQLVSAYARCGRRADAERAMRALLAHPDRSAFYVAAGYEGLGDHERALQWLEKAYAEHAELLVFANVDGLRNDPRFIALLRRVGLAARR